LRFSKFDVLDDLLKHSPAQEALNVEKLLLVFT